MLSEDLIIRACSSIDIGCSSLETVITHTTRMDGYTLGAASIDILYIFRFGMMSRFQNYAQWNRITSRLGEKSQNSHQKSPKSPNGGISPSLLNETCRASNFVWKNGITSFILKTQSIVKLIENYGFMRFLKRIRMKLMILIFHTEFDVLQGSSKRLGEIPPFGDLGYFRWLLWLFSPNRE